MGSPLLAIATLGLLAFTPVNAQIAEPRRSTPQERSEMLALIRSLEADPLSETAQEDRSTITLWLVEVSDMGVNWCTDLLIPLSDTRQPYHSEIGTQVMFSAVAFRIEQPRRLKDPLAVNTAALEGGLRAYQAILKREPKARWPLLDELIRKQSEGSLAEWVLQATESCGPKKKKR